MSSSRPKRASSSSSSTSSASKKQKSCDTKASQPSSSTATSAATSPANSRSTSPSPSPAATSTSTSTSSPSGVDQFNDEIETLLKSHPDHQVIMLEHIKRDDDEDDEDDEDEEEEGEENEKKPKSPPTLDECRALARIIIPKSVATQCDTMSKAILKAIDAEDGFMMTNTASSYPIIDMFQKHIASLTAFSKLWSSKPDSIKKFFGLLFTMTQMIEEYDFWYMDTDVPEESVKIVKYMFRTAWPKLLTRTDAEIGFVESRSRSDVQRWLKTLLEKIRTAMKDVGYDKLP